MMKPFETYRSPDLPFGVFSTSGNVHLHIDGGGDAAIVRSLLLRLERAGAKGKLNQIMGSVPGPQRALLPDTYASHTPGNDGAESFDYFATVNVGTRSGAIAHLRTLLPELVHHPGLVVEVERVIGRVDTSGRLLYADIPPLGKITAEDVGTESSPTLTFEIHHAFDLASQQDVPTLEDVARESADLGVCTGGWFRFAKRGLVAYRSNAFSDGTALAQLVEHEHAALSSYLAAHELDAMVRTVVEEVLGIWHSPASPTEQLDQGTTL